MAVVLFFLRRNRHRLNSGAVMTRYGLFFGGYREKRYYWETMIAARKASVVMLRVFGPALGVRAQAMCCLLLLLFYSVLEVAANPYKITTPRHTVLKQLELVQLLLEAAVLRRDLVVGSLQRLGALVHQHRARLPLQQQPALEVDTQAVEPRLQRLTRRLLAPQPRAQRLTHRLQPPHAHRGA